MSTVVRPSGGRSGVERGGIRLRPAEPRDERQVARTLYEAFADVHDHHRFARDFRTPEAAAELTRAFIAHPAIWGVVAERDGRIVGSNFVDERGPVRGVGPITVEPDAQGRGLGRRLMRAALARSTSAPGVRLLQDAFNTRSLALYASLGFRVADPVVVVAGRPRDRTVRGFEVRPLTLDHLAACDALHRSVHGYERTRELREAIDAPGLDPVVALHRGRVAAYATTLTFFPAAHGAAESEAAMAALIAGAFATDRPSASFLLPTRQHRLFRWALEAGLQVVKPMTYMVLGQPHRPRGAWIPSVLS